MEWFILGGVIAMAQLWWKLTRNPMPWNHPISAFATTFVLGAGGYGTILWFIFA